MAASDPAAPAGYRVTIAARQKYGSFGFCAGESLAAWTGEGCPPAASTRCSPLLDANRITPSLFQVPPSRSGVSEMFCGGPPTASTRFEPSAREERDPPAVGRPEQTTRAFRPRELLRRRGVDRANEHRRRSAVAGRVRHQPTVGRDGHGFGNRHVGHVDEKPRLLARLRSSGRRQRDRRHRDRQSASRPRARAARSWPRAADRAAARASRSLCHPQRSTAAPTRDRSRSAGAVRDPSPGSA